MSSCLLACVCLATRGYLPTWDGRYLPYVGRLLHWRRGSMATHGSINAFDSSQEDWTAYTERMEQYFAANDVDAATKRRTILLTASGAATYKLIRGLVAPDKPTDRSYTELVELVKGHYNPTPSPIVQRFKFNSRMRQQGENVATFVTALKQLTEHCVFGAALDDMLRDRLVCGIGDGKIQRRLLAESELTFKKAFELAQAMETADRDARDLGKPREEVHAIGGTAGGRKDVAPQTANITPRYHCGSRHRGECRFKNAVCHGCGKRGHIRRACRSRGKPQQSQQSGKRSQPHTANVLVGEGTEGATASDEDDTMPVYTMYNISNQGANPWSVTVQADRADLRMEIDTGASVSIISMATYQATWLENERPVLQPSRASLSTFTGEKIDVIGLIDVRVIYKGQDKCLPLLVVNGKGPSLLGRDWLRELRLDWREIHAVTSTLGSLTLQGLLEQHANVFRDELGTVRGVTAKLHVDPQARPRFYRPRPVPYAMRQKVELELERLERAGVIEPVQFSDWAAPIVPVVKTDGSIRICGDYKLTVNQVAKLDTYPLPRIEDLFASLSGGQAFTKLDLSNAYQQVSLDEASKAYVTINISRGLFRYNRLPFGVASAPSIFQRTMETLLQGIPHVSVYLDDILVTGASETDHLRNLAEVLQRLSSAGMRLKRSKCRFMLPEVEYLGHRISKNGLHPTKEKVRAISDAPMPTNVTQLKSFLGIVNYYSKFLPSLSSTLAPLYRLLQKRTRWSWGPDQIKAFVEAKSVLTSQSLLVHYSPDKEILLSCDASPYGVGAVLSHRMKDGSEQPVAYASRSLAPAEKNYAQLDKEALAIVFGVTYLLGRHFTIKSDHKPLMHLFSESRGVPLMASARVQRWALTLSAYDYTIDYKPGKDHANADVLSRLPLPEMPSEVPLPGEMILLMECLQTSTITAAQIRRWTERDPVLAKVRDYVMQGWPLIEGSVELLPYSRRRAELCVQDGCLLWGRRVVVPSPGRAQVIEVLHEGHPGSTRMKSLSRSYVWWPGLDAAVEERVRSCDQCQSCRKSPARAPLHPWEWLERPWARVHADYVGPFMGKMFLLLIDAHSKWMEVHIVASATSASTMEKMRVTFATHGLPETLVTDNGSVFTSAEFQEFLKKNGIRHVTSAPYHPASNGLAERAVQVFKEGMRKAMAGTLETKVARFLLKYRITPHSTTGRPPAELLMARRLRSQLDQLHPDHSTSERVRLNQERQKGAHDGVFQT